MRHVISYKTSFLNRKNLMRLLAFHSFFSLLFFQFSNKNKYYISHSSIPLNFRVWILSAFYGLIIFIRYDKKFMCLIHRQNETRKKYVWKSKKELNAWNRQIKIENIVTQNKLVLIYIEHRHCRKLEKIHVRLYLYLFCWIEAFEYNVNKVAWTINRICI